MGIVFRHDAAAVALPANSASRKYGQQLVLQQQQQKYNAQQAGYDRMFQLGRDAQQNQAQFIRDVRQNTMLERRDRAQNDFVMGRDKTLFDQQQQMQRAKDFEAARSRIDTHAKDMLANGDIKDPAARQRIQNLIAGKTIVMGSEFDETARKSYLDQYNAELAKILSEVPQPRPQPTPQEQFEQSVITDPQTGMRYIPNAKGGLEPLPESKQQQQMRPRSFQDYYNENEDKFQKDLDATMTAMQDSLEPDKDGNVAAVTPEQALAQMQKDYEFRQKALGRPTYGTPNAAPELPGAQPAVPGQSRSILETAPTAPAAPQNPMAARPDPGMPPAPTDAAIYEAQMTGQGYKLKTPEGGGSPYYYKDATPAPAPAPAPDRGMPPSPTSWSTMTREQKQIELGRLGASPQAIAGSDAELDRSYAFHSKPISQDMSDRPDQGKPPAPEKQQVNVSGKPLAVTPGTLTPQETEARAKIMAMPQEDRIKSLMQYDPQFKGKTLEQILDDPQTKAQYDELSKKGLTTGNYREDILNHMDETLQHNVLKGAGQMPQDAYVGMRADEVTDPKAKEEVAKMPRPKSPEEMNGIRGPYFIDPTGVIRSTRR